MRKVVWPTRQEARTTTLIVDCSNDCRRALLLYVLDGIIVRVVGRSLLV